MTDSLFYSFVSTNLQVALHALETNGRTQVLSAPSLVVMNNQPAQIQVGDNTPISQTTVNTSNSDTTLSSVEYIQTGVILDVVPRINPGGLIKQDNSESDSSVPYLGRIPGLRWLFGNTSKSKDRTELIVLITPRVITSSSQSRQVTDDYRQQMQLLKQ